MCPVIDPSEVLKIEMGIDLRRADISMPQALLDRSQVGTRFEQVARERVAQHVGMHMTRGPISRPARETGLDRPRRESTTSLAHEECPLIGSSDLAA